jgi:hypothetical protein
MKPSADLRARVLEAARRETSPPRPVVRRWTAAAIALGFAPLLLVFYVVLDGIVLGKRPIPFAVITGAGWVALALVATWGSLARGGSMLGRPKSWLIALAIGTPLVLIALHFVCLSIWPEAWLAARRTQTHVNCFGFASLMALAPLAAFVFVRRSSDPLHPGVTAVAVAVAAAAWGSAAITLHCPVTSGVHVLAAHIGPLALFAALGGALASRLVAVR